MSAKQTKTCRACLGAGCIHCNKRGYFTVRTYSAAEREAARLRRSIFGVTNINQQVRA